MSIFKNTEVAFKDKNRFDLYRAYLLFKIISNPILSKILITILCCCCKKTNKVELVSENKKNFEDGNIF